MALPGRIEFCISCFERDIHECTKQFITMKIHFSPVFCSLVEVESVIILYLQLPSILDPEGIGISEEELWGKKLRFTRVICATLLAESK